MGIAKGRVIAVAVACLSALITQATPSSRPAATLAAYPAGDSGSPSALGTPPALAGIQIPSVLATNFDDGSLRKTNKIAPVLDKLYRVDLLSRVMANRPITAGTASALTGDLGGLIATNRMRIDDLGRVQVWVDAAETAASAVADLVALGMRVQRVDDQDHIVQGLLAVPQLPAASALASVADVRLPEYGVAQAGSVTTQGDGILNAATLRNTLTSTGNGVRVGVISDGMEGLAASQSTNDLGPVDTTTCNEALQADTSPPPPPPSPTASGAGAEGTAMAEIVHDIAPGAQLFFGYFGSNVGGTALDFNAAVNCLAAHADVVVDDIGWFNTGPYDGTSFISSNTSAALNNAANRIRGYYTAVANQAQNHYHGTFLNSGFPVGNLATDWWELHQFQGGAGTTDGGFGLQCSSTVRCGDTIEVSPGGSFSVFLQWNDPFGSSTNDYDLLYQDNTAATIVLGSTNRQGAGFPLPDEGFSVTNTHGVNTVYNILIGNYKSLAVPRNFDMYIICTGCFVFSTGLPAPDNFSFHNYNTLAGSVPSQSDAGGGVVSVGAISAADSPGFDTIDYYSSRGPTADARTKPDVTGIDCVAITGAAGFPNPFCGSSAAAPHAASIAALLLSCNPMLLADSPSGTPASNRTTLHDALLNSAVDLGVAGVDNTYGHGRLNTVTAAPLAGCVDTDGDGYPDGLETSMGKSPNIYCAIMRADINGDGVVNVQDLTLFAKQFAVTVPPAPPRVDQNADGVINVQDLTLFAKAFAHSVNECP